MITVALVSDDHSLERLCREVLAEFFGTDFALTMGLDRGALSCADLVFWEFVPDGSLPLRDHVDLRRLHDNFFVAHRGEVDALKESVGTSNINVLLKPLTPATLRAFLGEACWRWRSRDNDFAARKLRAERDEMLQCLIQANLRLQEYDQDRTTFLARSVHDFRAPVTAISGYCALLLAGALGSLTAEQQEVVERMQYSVRRLSRMSQAMFQLSISNYVEQKLVLEYGDIRESVERALQEIASSIDEKRISVSVSIEPSDLVAFEKGLVEQLFINLLDNASRFTPRNGTIEIRGYPFFWDRRLSHAAPLDPSKNRRIEQICLPNSFRIDIHDSGPGIPVTDTEKIFEEFTSYCGGQDRSGGGLGLAICRMIMRQHQGRIWAENGPAGAVFSFVLPYQRTEVNAPGDGNRWKNAVCSAGS